MSTTSPFPADRTRVEQGYKLSPITQLKSEFMEEHEEVSSTHTRAMTLASKKTLSSLDIVDHGAN